MRTLKVIAVMAALSGGAAAFGQATEPPAAGGAPAVEDAVAKRERMLKAIKLPKRAADVRAKGVPDAEVKEAMREAKSKGLKAGEMAEVTGEQSKAIDEHGPIDNFGAFVKGKLAEGLRGKDLAAAIKAEHVKRGKGKGWKAGGKGAEKGKAGDGAGKPEGKGKPEGAGKPDDKKPEDKKPEDAKPDGKGKPEGKGKG